MKAIFFFFLLLLQWHYSLMQTSTSKMDFSPSAVFLPHFPMFNFAFINVCLYTTPPLVFWSSSQPSSLRITIKYLDLPFLCESYSKPKFSYMFSYTFCITKLAVLLYFKLNARKSTGKQNCDACCSNNPAGNGRQKFL